MSLGQEYAQPPTLHLHLHLTHTVECICQHAHIIFGVVGHGLVQHCSVVQDPVAQWPVA